MSCSESSYRELSNALIFGVEHLFRGHFTGQKKKLLDNYRDARTKNNKISNATYQAYFIRLKPTPNSLVQKSSNISRGETIIFWSTSYMGCT